jgi:prepilin-type N-terminal cleavage/methylation domain-containing protein
MPKVIHSPIHKHWKLIGQNQRTSGFTLIELIVAISIMVLLVGGGITSYLTFNDNQQLEGSARQIQSYLRAAQTRARVGDRPVGCTKLEAYKVLVAASSSELQLLTVCDGGVETLVNTTQLVNVESVTTDQGPGLSIEFLVLYGGTDFNGVVTVSSSSGRDETFSVSSGGEISDLGAN